MVESVIPWDALLRLTWPAAVASIAFSPLGRGVGAWLQGLGGGNGGKDHPTADRLVAAMERMAGAQEKMVETQHEIIRMQVGQGGVITRQSEVLDRQCTTMQQMHLALAELIGHARGG